jgi:hypothetical protein
MRLREISPVQHRLLEQLASGISTRLEAQFVELADRDDAHIGVMLKEASRQVVIELPVAMLTQADDPGGREQLRTRMKARRDRMMFKTPPAPLPKNVAPLFHPGPPRGGGFRGGRR